MRRAGMMDGTTKTKKGLRYGAMAWLPMPFGARWDPLCNQGARMPEAWGCIELWLESAVHIGKVARQRCGTVEWTKMRYSGNGGQS